MMDDDSSSSTQIGRKASTGRSRRTDRGFDDLQDYRHEKKRAPETIAKQIAAIRRPNISRLNSSTTVWWLQVDR
jgi:hypothetical protein